MPPKSSAKAGTKPAPSHKTNWKGKDPKSAPNQKQNPNPKQKQPLPLPERLKRLFTSLCAQIDGGHFGGAVKTCDKILRLDPKDPDARKTKLFLLLQTEAYAAALALIDEVQGSSDDPNSKDYTYAYERAYTLYRLQREAEARDALAGLKEAQEKGEGVEKLDEGVQRGVVHLEAQLNYREGAYQAAVDLYNELLDTAEPNTEEHSDILTNLSATQRHLEFINTGFLRALDALPSSVTSALESAPPPVPPTVITTTSPFSAHATQGPSQAQAQAQGPDPHPPKKPRKSRVPPGVVPGVTPPPDPERWVKKSERAGFGAGGAAGRRRKAGGGGGASQGLVENVGAGGGGVQQTGGATGQGGAGQGKSGGGGGKAKKRK